jgi:hypothetical protein
MHKFIKCGTFLIFTVTGVNAADALDRFPGAIPPLRRGKPEPLMAIPEGGHVTNFNPLGNKNKQYDWSQHQGSLLVMPEDLGSLVDLPIDSPPVGLPIDFSTEGEAGGMSDPDSLVTNSDLSETEGDR